MFNEDLTVFFQPQEFAVKAWVRGRAIAGFLSPAYPTVSNAAEHFTFVCVVTEVSSLGVGEWMTIEEHRYQLLGIQPDGTGLATLTLKEMECT